MKNSEVRLSTGFIPGISKTFVFVIIIMLGATACNTSQLQQQQAQIKALKAQDSLSMSQMQQKDSSLMAYVRSINNIQKGIDTIMRDAKILKMHRERVSDTGTLLADLRTIHAVVLRNQRALVVLQRKLKKSEQANNDLVDLGEALSRQLNEKDSEIAAIQNELVRTKASLKTVVQQFNDSLEVIMKQRAEIGLMKIQGNTVYYVAGRQKILANMGLINVEGGVVGLGHVPTVNADMTMTGFIKADLTQLHQIELNGQFVKMVTPHPTKSYRVTGGASGKIIITDPQDFWSKSKYMIAIVR